MNKLYTLPISVQAVDTFFKDSVSLNENVFQLRKISDSLISLFVLFQDYTHIKQLRFRGDLTNISLQRFFQVIEDLDILLPKETPESLKKIQKALLLLLEENKPKTISIDFANNILKMLRKEGNIWSDPGFAEFMNIAFEYTLEVSPSDMESLKISLANVAHQDPQANYEEQLKVKRVTDLEIDTNIYFRASTNGTKDPSCLLIGDQGANKFKYLEKLPPAETKLLNFLYKRRFGRIGLAKGTDVKSLAKKFKMEENSINARKSSIDKKVFNRLGKKLFTQDTQLNITFACEWSCMREALRIKHQMRHQF